MTTFIILGKLTPKAIENVKEMAERDAKGEQVIKAADGKLLTLYYTLGRYDFVALVDLPSEEALVKVLLELGKRGTISTETLTALKPEQVYRAAQGL